VSQYIKFGDLTAPADSMASDHVDTAAPTKSDLPLVNVNGNGNSSNAPLALNGRAHRPTGMSLPAAVVDFMGEQVESYLSDDPELSPAEEDAVLREATGGFPDWVASFIRRVILLFDNLPEESGGSTEGARDADGPADDEDEDDTEPCAVQLVDSVTNACSQICAHLSEPLFELVLGIVFDFASTSVRPNAVRAVHQLVECVANADPVKTLARFFPFCVRNIYIELESGASSVRTTSTKSTPMPADATFHWSANRSLVRILARRCMRADTSVAFS
jgi:proteasome activator subunit 4